MTIGILAYGSLIEDPGVEIEPLIHRRISNVMTPFSVEFARSSSTREGAPTIVPVEKCGSPVGATILVLDEATTKKEAEDLLWRRETRNEDSDKHYTRPATHSSNRVVVEEIANFSGLKTVLYTKIGENIKNPSAKKLASLAICSAQSDAVNKGKDGISYLLSVKRQNITTPLMEEYENQILSRLGVVSLEEALSICREKSN